MTFDVFAPLASPTRVHHREAYVRHLVERNGRFDVLTGTFERRVARLEGWMKATAPVTLGPAERALFELQYQRFDPNRRTHGSLLVLLAIVKLDVSLPGERHWLDRLIPRAFPLASGAEFFALAEEAHDVQVLRSTACAFGLPAPDTRRVGRAARAALTGFSRAPPLLRGPIRLARRILDVVALLELLRVSSAVLRDRAALRDQVEERLIDVLVDRVGHVSLARTQLGARELSAAQAAIPALTIALLDQRREMSALGAFMLFPSTEVIRHRLNSLLPAAVRDHAYLA